MTARFRISLMAAALFGLATFGAVRSAEAAIRLHITVYDTASTVVGDTGNITAAGPVVGTGVVGGSALLIPGSGDTTLTFTGTVGGVVFSFSTNAITNEPGTAANAFLNLVGNRTTNNAGADRRIVVEAEADGYYLPVTAPLVHSLSASITGATGTFTGDDPTAFGKVSGGTTFSGVATDQMIVTGTSQSISANPPHELITTNLTAPFTMYTQFAGTLASGTTYTGFSIDHQIAPVPEPSTIAMAGAGVVLSLGALRRRNRA